MENVVKEFEAFVKGNCPADFKHVCHIELMEKVLTILKEYEAQRDYEASVEMAEYCEHYEQTYNPEDGSM